VRSLRLVEKPARVTGFQAGAPTSGIRDASGYEVFSAGPSGEAHVMAHRLLDQERYDLGHRFLEDWLHWRSGAGSDWVHLQWHMAVFELGLGRWAAAYSRFWQHILPVAATTEDALTDAPAMLWRLMLAARTPVALPWEPVRATALVRMRRPSHPYVELHNLLALAGAGDVAGLDRWHDRQTSAPRTRARALVERVARGLRAYAVADYGQCAAILGPAVPCLGEVGGSRGQNRLFRQIETTSRTMSSGHVSSWPLPIAA